IKAIEIKLSQGAKPGKGGVLPASKITPEIAAIRGVPLNQDVISPPYHKAFSNVEEMIDFIESVADVTGLPVGIKSAIGKLDDWVTLIDLMKKTDNGPDFITIDGGEGGTGAAPPSFADHMSIPLMYAFTDVYRLFKNEGMADKMVFIASAKLGFPAKAAMAFGMGADLINVAREAMISIGCIQAQKCHNNTCPTGVATQNKWLTRGIVVPEKAERLNNYFTKFKKEFVEITHALGYEHPCQISMRDIDINLGDKHLMQTLESTFGYQKVPVPFENMQKLRDCVYLGGCYATVVEKQADKLEFVNEL
ncbi:MAG: FMN-binding glutamate synthase family protein, partial [Flavobacteriaceae bacterium]|nr:FMN-binding glutamate synthase family protein [Flavobacteriaceae bacterium]